MDVEDKQKSNVDEFLDETYNKDYQIPMVVPKYQKTKLSKIEKAGEEVIQHLFELAKTTDLSYNGMADRINEIYKLDITKNNVALFFKTNLDIIDKLAKEQMSLSKVRADLYLDHNATLVKDIKILDNELDIIMEEGKMVEPDKRAKAIADLIDKKGKLLLRSAKLSGKLIVEKPSSAVQVNIFNDANKEKSELMKRLKRADFKEEVDPIDVTPDASKE